jgi:hypothetical protein
MTSGQFAGWKIVLGLSMLTSIITSVPLHYAITSISAILARSVAKFRIFDKVR